MKVYTPKDFTPEFIQTIADAAAAWAVATERYIVKHGDQGTCVVGAGIGVEYLGPRKRNPEALMLINAPGLQGASSWEATVKGVLAFLSGRGIEARYLAGRMD